MKLYTEEQVRKAIMIAENQKIGFTKIVREHLTPIELPSDEEIDKKFEPRSTMYELGYRDGAKWLKNKIQGGNK